MIFVHLVFWLLIVLSIFILIKCHEYINAIIVLLGGLFIEKLHLTTNNCLISIVGIFIAVSTFSTLMAMFKQWIKMGVLITVLYWLGS
ncbi:unnamed protein product [Rotaria magnacalcarata]